MKEIARLTRTSETCPACDTNLIDSEIPQENRYCYLGFVKNSQGEYEPAPDHGRPMYYYRTIGIYDVYKDRTVAYKCPDCGHQSERL